MANIASEAGDVTLHGKDIQLAAGHEKKHDAYGQQYKAQGLFSSTKTTLAYDSQKDTVLAPTLIGRNITLNAENSIKAEAPRLAAEQDITLKAADISLAAEATHEKEGGIEHVDSKQQAMRLGRTVGKILVLFAPGSAASKSINLSKYPRLSKLFNTAEANAKDTLKIDLKASSGKNIFGWDKTKTIKASDLQDYARK